MLKMPPTVRSIRFAECRGNVPKTSLVSRRDKRNRNTLKLLCATGVDHSKSPLILLNEKLGRVNVRGGELYQYSPKSLSCQ
jgi:hypothetical protein